MTVSPTLLFLHGVGQDPDDEWMATLEATLTGIGYPDLASVEVIAPKYPNSLNGVDDDVDLPKQTVRSLRGDFGTNHRRDYARRRTAMEAMLGRDDRGDGLPGGDQVAPVVAGLKQFLQADNYVNDPKVRAWVLRRILDRLPDEGRLVIIGHSLGSVIAADLIRRLPADLEVAGMVTIGSPLAHEAFHVDGLRSSLSGPPKNLAWWVNLWSTADPVPARRGVSTAFRWVLDQRIRASVGLHPIRAHSATTYMQDKTVATAIGYGIFGSQSTAIVPAEVGLDIPLDFAEKFALLGLRYAHLMMSELDGEARGRYAEARRQSQEDTVEQVRARNSVANRPMPRAIADLTVDLCDPISGTPEPGAPGHLTIEDAVVLLVAIAEVNVIQPYEVEVGAKERRRAMEQLTLDMQLGGRLGANVFEALETSRKALKGPTNWVKWAALGAGGAAVVAATGGLALAAAPGVAGAAAVTSALAAFGPGGMIGGLLTAGTLMTAGGGSVAVGLAAPGTTAEAVEAVVASQLAAAVLRDLEGVTQDPQTWRNLADAEIATTHELERLEAVSDESAPSLKELRRKLVAFDRALRYLRDHGLGPDQLEAVDH